MEEDNIYRQIENNREPRIDVDKISTDDKDIAREGADSAQVDFDAETTDGIEVEDVKNDFIWKAQGIGIRPTKSPDSPGSSQFRTAENETVSPPESAVTVVDSAKNVETQLDDESLD